MIKHIKNFNLYWPSNPNHTFKPQGSSPISLSTRVPSRLRKRNDRSPLNLTLGRFRKMKKYHINKWGQIVRLTDDEKNPGREVHWSIPLAIVIGMVTICLIEFYSHVSA